MADRRSPRDALPARLAEILERQDAGTLAAIRAFCDELVDEDELEETFDERAY